MTRAHEEEVASLKQQLVTEKEKARKSWKTNCEHLAEQDVIITAQEEEVAALKKQLVELQARASEGRDDLEPYPSAAGLPQPEEHHSISGAAERDLSRVPVEVHVLSSPPSDLREEGQPANDHVRPAGIVSSPGSTPGSLSGSAVPPRPIDPPDGRWRQGKALRSFPVRTLQSCWMTGSPV